MPVLYMTPKQFSKMPYSGTEKKWTSTKGEMEGKLFELREKGILKKKAWVEDEDGIETLVIEMELRFSDTQTKRITMKFQPVMIYVQKEKGSTRKGTKKKYNELKKDTSWRLFWWYFKSKLEAVQYGLESMEDVFMANIVHYLPDGTEVTLGEALERIILDDKLNNLLTDDRERPRKAVEVNVS